MIENYTIGTVAENYPDAVKEFVIETMVGANQLQLLEDVDPAILEEILCKSALQKFLDDGEMMWSEEEVYDALNLAEVRSLIVELFEEGLVDSIEDENGEEIVWLTEKGKRVVETVKNTQYDTADITQ
jgi:hypothetical protein